MTTVDVLLRHDLSSMLEIAASPTTAAGCLPDSLSSPTRPPPNTLFSGLGWCSGRKNTLGNIESGRLGRQPRPSAAATSSTKTTSSPTTPLPSSMDTQVKLAVMVKVMIWVSYLQK